MPLFAFIFILLSNYTINFREMQRLIWPILASEVFTMERKSEKARLTEAGKLLHNADSDPLGMYTGNPEDPYEKPVQDADDL